MGTSTNAIERTQADKLLDICTRKTPKVNDIQECILDLLDIIAKNFGLRKKTNTNRRLQAFALPAGHDIGIDPDKRENDLSNPFEGVTLRDDRSRLLGYIIYPLKTKKEAAKLKKYLEKNNRFHNVLVIYPDNNNANLELWQGRQKLTGKLRKGQGYKDAASVVNLLSRFFVVSKAKVKNPKELAEELAYRARYLRKLAINQLDEEKDEGPLRNLYNAFKESLIHDQTEEEFANAFAQTITYGLLTARWTGNEKLIEAGERFTRQTALKFIPETSPFLNELFKSILSMKINEQQGKMLWLVDDIADLLDRIDVSYVFGAGDVDSDTSTDPVIHFYELFLAAYDKELRNRRGVFFTPRPVVSYIVRSVHELLQKEFGLEDGLASTDTWGDVAKRIKGLSIPEGVKPEDPFVCILDPATGTGTFLLECIEVIERTMKDLWCRELKKKDWKDSEVLTKWSEYVSKHLLPRLFGYELMMAPYAVAHLKLAFKLRETGYQLGNYDNIKIYLTNTLEPPDSKANSKFLSMFKTLAKQAKDVNQVKLNKRFTIVIGNPPYSNYGQMNSNEWILGLISLYKHKLNEKKLNLDDDYIKFFRFAHLMIEQTGYGVVGLITNHTYLDGITHRRLRQSFLKSFGLLHFLDLHGSIKKAEQCPDGTPDNNVFDIQQGVAIALMAKITNVDEENQIKKTFHADLWGSREAKSIWLKQESISSTSWVALRPSSSRFFFSPKNTEHQEEYQSFLSLRDMFHEVATGFETARDHFAIGFTANELRNRIDSLLSSASDNFIQNELGLDDKRDWSLAKARERLRATSDPYADIKRCCYRPFDFRFTHYNDIIATWPRLKVLGSISSDNPAIVATRMIKGEKPQHFFVVQEPTDRTFISGKTSTSAFIFPIYIKKSTKEPHNKKKNYGKLILNIRKEAICTLLKKRVIEGLEDDWDDWDMLAFKTFHYLYAIFSSPCYRIRYQEFLKLDFPRVPHPVNEELFLSLSELGRKLIAIHALDSIPPYSVCSNYVGEVSPKVEKITYEKETIWIDKKKTCGFINVPEDVWTFYVGGYQICKKWLKDRRSKGSQPARTLNKHEISHYQKILRAISETIRIMKEIDIVIEQHGGWPEAFITKK
jgi:predicted helicase